MLAFYNIATARVAGAGGLDQAIEPANFRVKAEVLEIVCVCVCVCVCAHAHMCVRCALKTKAKVTDISEFTSAK